MSAKKLKIDAFFSGVGGIELGFKQTSHYQVIYANEFDKYASKTYQLNNPDVNLDTRDIHEINPNEIPDCDLIVGGFPCQSFSIAGYRKGFKDPRGTLFFEMLRMIQTKQPKVVFMENVKNLVTHDNGNTFKVIKEALEQNGYYVKYKVLNAKDYGNLPQNRERIYIVAFKNKHAYDNFIFPKPIKLTKTVYDVIDFKQTADEKYYYTKSYKRYDLLKNSIKQSGEIYQLRRVYVRQNKSHVVPTLTASMGTGGNNVPLILTNDKRIRKLTPRECFNVQGYPADFKLPKELSNSRLYKQAGNSVAVPVIKRIAQQIFEALN